MSQLEAEYVTLNHLQKLALKQMQAGNFDSFNRLMVECETVKERIKILEEGDKQ